MQNFRRRIERLEKSRRIKRDVHQGLAQKAMSWLWPVDAEHLIGAYGAGRVGRPFTEREAAARRTFTEALERECRWAGTHSIRCDHTPDINEDIIHHAVIAYWRAVFPPNSSNSAAAAFARLKKVVSETKENQLP